MKNLQPLCVRPNPISPKYPLPPKLPPNEGLKDRSMRRHFPFSLALPLDPKENYKSLTPLVNVQKRGLEAAEAPADDNSVKREFPDQGSL